MNLLLLIEILLLICLIGVLIEDKVNQTALCQEKPLDVSRKTTERMIPQLITVTDLSL